MKQTRRSVSLGCLCALLVALAPVAARAAGGKRAGVPKFEGAQEALIRKQVMKALKAHGYELAKSREMENAVQNTGVLLESDDAFQKVAKELALSVIVTGEVGKKKAKLVVHDGREGSVLGEAAFPGPNPRKMAAAVAKTFWSKLGADLERGRTPSGAKKPQKAVAEAPEDDENAPDAAGEAAGGEESKPKVAEAGEGAESQASSEGDSDSGSRHKKKKKQVKMDGEVLVQEGSETPSTTGVPPTFEVVAGGGGVNRSYNYHQNLTGLRAHSLPLGGTAAAQIVVYPLAAFTDGAAQHLGVQASFEQAFGIQSSLGADGSSLANTTFGNTEHEFEGGLRYRIPFGAAVNQLWLSGSGGEHAFLFTGRSKQPATLDIPDVIYRYARAGVGLRLELPSDLSLSVSGGYRYIFNRGGEQFSGATPTGFFPHVTVQGIDAELALGYRVMDSLEVRLGGELRRYFSSMHSVAADPFKVGGAIDQYWSFGIGLAYLYGGSPRAVVAEQEAPPPAKKHKRHEGDEGDAGGGDAPAVEAAGGGGGNAE